MIAGQGSPVANSIAEKKGIVLRREELISIYPPIKNAIRSTQIPCTTTKKKTIDQL